MDNYKNTKSREILPIACPDVTLSTRFSNVGTIVFRSIIMYLSIWHDKRYIYILGYV